MVSSAVGGLGLALEFVRRDDEDAVGPLVRHVDDLEVAAGHCLAEAHPRVALALEIFPGGAHHFRNFFLGDAVSVDVGLFCLRVVVEADVHCRPSSSNFTPTILADEVLRKRLRVAEFFPSAEPRLQRRGYALGAAHGVGAQYAGGV